MANLFRNKLTAAISLFTFITLLLFISYVFFYPLTWEIDEESFFVLVEKGDNLPKISQKLKSSGLEFNSQLLYLSSILLNVDRKIFPAGMIFKKG